MALPEIPVYLIEWNLWILCGLHVYMRTHVIHNHIINLIEKLSGRINT